MGWSGYKNVTVVINGEKKGLTEAKEVVGVTTVRSRSSDFKGSFHGMPTARTVVLYRTYHPRSRNE